MDVVNFDALKAQDRIIKKSDVNLDEDYFILGHYDPRRREFKATDYPVYLVKADDVLRITSFTNPFEFYLDSSAPAGGIGTYDQPFNTLTQLNNAIIALGTPTQSYVGYLKPSVIPYGAEVSGTLNLATNLNLIGVTPQTTFISCNLQLTTVVGNPKLNYKNIGFTGIFNMNLTSSSNTVSVLDSTIRLNRTDGNLTSQVIVRGEISDSNLDGLVLINQSSIAGLNTIQPGANVYIQGSLILGSTFTLTGNCILKTLNILNPVTNYIIGVVDISGTPSWFTDVPSDTTYLGTLTKTLY